MTPLAISRTGDEWPDRWFVTNGVVAVGPVSFELLLRGVALGRIPRGSVVRHESWQVWRRLEDIGALMVLEHVAMLASMLGVMLLRPAEYTCGVHGRRTVGEQVAA